MRKKTAGIRGKIKSIAIKLFALVIAAFVPSGLNAAEKPVKIYILAGQSNMNTFRHSDELLKENYPDVEMPSKNVWFVQDDYRGGLPKPGGWGVETPFGLDLAKEIKEPILLFKSNQGGTTLTKDWLPPSAVKRSGGEVGYLYNRMIRRFHNMIKDIETICPPVKERGYEIAGFVWFQGESDACYSDPELWKDYEQKLRELIADVRRDVGVPDLPFLNIQINNIPLWDGKPDAPKGGGTIRAAQKKVAEEDPKGYWISTSNLSKGYHYDATAHFTIGKRMAVAMLPSAKEVVPTDPAKVAGANKTFRERTYPDTKPDVSSLKQGLIFYLPFEEDDKASLNDLISGKKGNIIGDATHCEGLFGKGVFIDRGGSRNNPNCIEFPDFKDPVKDGKIGSMSVSFWVQTPSGHVGDAITKYVQDKEHNSMKDGWRMIISAYGQTGMNAMVDGVTEWNPNPPKPKKGEEPKKGSPHVHARKAGNSTAFGDGVEWHHVVAVYDGAAKTMRAYVDAGMDPGSNPKRYPWAKDIPGVGIQPSDAPLKILSCSRSAGMRSALDEIAIWDRPLSDEEIKTLYNNGNGVQIK
jgi:hypothetical protein